ncbi:hypothetical protein ACLKA7_001157 [Drosophila subpalustris]
MPSTVEQLQQLTNNELFLLCHKYHIPARHIAYLSRRQLERRVHVAIVAERAKLRAHDVVNRIRNQEEQLNLHSWVRLLHHSAPTLSRRMPLSSWRNSQGYNWPTPERFRGGVDYLKHLEYLRHYEEGYDYEYDTALSQDESLASLEAESEQTDSIHETKQQWQDAYKSLDEPMAAMSTNYIEYSTTRDPATDYYSLSNDDGSRSTVGSDQRQLHKADKFAHWTVSIHNMPLESEREMDPSSEQELCTINYLEELQPGDHINNKSSRDSLENSENLRIGDSLPTDQPARRQRRSLWSYILELFCCDSQGKLDAAKLRYSIVCCAMVICTFAGYKMLR